MTIIAKADVIATCGLSSTDLTSLGISDSDILQHIYEAESEVQYLCNTCFLQNDSALLSASEGSANSLTTTGAFTGKTYAGYFVYIYSGTGSGQWNQVSSHTNDVLTLTYNFTTVPNNTSKYYVVYAPYCLNLDDNFNPLFSRSIDGNGQRWYCLPRFPILQINTLSIAGVSVTPSSLYQYKWTSKIQLSNTSESSFFYNDYPQRIAINYFYGVYNVPMIVKRAMAVIASMRTLTQQMGGTWNTPANFSLPEMSGSIGQASVNINATAERLKSDWEYLSVRLPKYDVVA